MPRTTVEIMRAAEQAIAEQNIELAQSGRRQMLAVTAQAAEGSGDIDEAFALNVRFRLVFVRCHFAGSGPAGPMTISLDAAAGASHDAKLFTILRAGPGRDVNFRLSAQEIADPSAWTFQAGDALRIQWTNPGAVQWGLQVGLSIAA